MGKDDQGARVRVCTWQYANDVAGLRRAGRAVGHGDVRGYGQEQRWRSVQGLARGDPGQGKYRPPGFFCDLHDRQSAPRPVGDHDLASASVNPWRDQDQPSRSGVHSPPGFHLQIAALLLEHYAAPELHAVQDVFGQPYGAGVDLTITRRADESPEVATPGEPDRSALQCRLAAGRSGDRQADRRLAVAERDDLAEFTPGMEPVGSGPAEPGGLLGAGGAQTGIGVLQLDESIRMVGGSRGVQPIG